MYARCPQLAALAAKADAEHDPRPIILCEYAHSMGNSTGNLWEYWQMFESLRRCQGGFIWDWADQCLIKTELLPDGKQVQSTKERTLACVLYSCIHVCVCHPGSMLDTLTETPYCGCHDATFEATVQARMTCNNNGCTSRQLRMSCSYLSLLTVV